MAGWAVSAGGGPPSHVRAANDGPLEERGQSDHNRDTAETPYALDSRSRIKGVLLLWSGIQQ